MAKAKNLNLHLINPLICDDGDTIPVQSVLQAVSNLLCTYEPGQIPFDANDTFGLGMILDTCRAALEHMNTGVCHE